MTLIEILLEYAAQVAYYGQERASTYLFSLGLPSGTINAIEDSVDESGNFIDDGGNVILSITSAIDCPASE